MKSSKNKKNKDNGSDLKRLFKVLGLSLLIVLLLAAIVMFISRFTGFSLFSSNQNDTEVPDGVIFQIDSDNVKSVSPYDNGVVLLTNSAVQYLDSSGREIETNKHNYASPELQINGKTLFLYDKGGSGYRLEKNGSIYTESTASGTITCGAIGKKDNYAFSLDNDEGYQSHIFVYSFKGEKQFEWGSASDYCFRMALSDTGNKIALCVIGVENAEYYSKVMLFGFNSGQPSYTVDFSGKTVFDIDFVSSRKIVVYTDSGIYMIDPDGEYSAVLEYTSSEIVQSFVSPYGLRCVAVNPYGNEQAPQITAFDERNKILFTHQYNELISGVVCSGSYVGVMMFDRVQILNRDNKVLGDILPGEACEKCVIVNHYLYILTGTGLHRYNIYFDTEKNASVPSTAGTTAAPEETSAPTEPSQETASAEPDEAGPSSDVSAEPEEPAPEDDNSDKGENADEGENADAEKLEDDQAEDDAEETEEVLFG